MCNLCLVAGDIEIKDEKIFADLLTVGALRGTDSTGVGAIPINPKASTRVIKDLAPPTALIESKGYDRVLKVKNKVLLGHNRAATKGFISMGNAHPFHFVDPDHHDKSLIMGAHNGTLWAKYEEDLGSSEWGTDSQTIFWSLAVRPDPRDTIKRLDGAYALIWYDYRTNLLYMIRNKERTLFYRFSKSRKSLYVASEMEMLFLAMNRNSVKGDGNAHLLAEDMLTAYKVPITGQFEEPVTRERVEGKKWPVTTTQYTSSGGSSNTTSNNRTAIKPNAGMVWSYYSGEWVWPYELERQKIDPNLKFDDKKNVPSSEMVDDGENGDDCPFETSTATVMGPLKEFVDGVWVEIENPMTEIAEDIVSAATLKPGSTQKSFELGYPPDLIPKGTSCTPTASTEKLGFAICTAGSTSVGTPAKPMSTIKSPSSPKPPATLTPPAKPSVPKPVTLVQLHKKRKYNVFVTEHQLKETARSVYEGEDLAAWWDGLNRKWTICKWLGPMSGWAGYVRDYAPPEIPYSVINIDAGGDHRFEYTKIRSSTTGKKFRKVYWKGYAGSRLDRDLFESRMKDGCIQCGRNPVWGNPVVFVTHDVFFCEHCAIDQKTVDEFLKLNKESKKALAM